MTAPEAAAGELARLLCAGADTALELGGATAIFEAIAGQPLSAEIDSGAARPLTEQEAGLLQPGARDTAYERAGLLRTAAGVPVAAITAVILPRRIPGPARPALGISTAGTPVPGHPGVPLGRALRGFGVRRRQLEALPVDAGRDDAGGPQVLYSAALLHAGRPVALVTERVYLVFLDAYPPPWPRVPAAARAGAL